MQSEKKVIASATKLMQVNKTGNLIIFQQNLPFS